MATTPESRRVVIDRTAAGPPAPRTRGVLALVLVLLPAAGLAALGVVVVDSTTARQSMALFGDPGHFTQRQIASLVLAVAWGGVAAGLGGARLLRMAPWLFAIALAAAVAVFIPGVGVRAAGAHRWLRIGPLSVAPAPFLVLGTVLLLCAWGRPETSHALPGDEGRLRHVRRRRGIAVLLALGAVVALVAEPDFSVAVVAVVAGVVALAVGGFGGRHLVPVALVLALVLAVVASRFGYVAGRLTGFVAPETHRRGAGFEVLALARSAASAPWTGVGLGRGTARRNLSSPATDYVMAVVREELGMGPTAAVLGAWVCIGVGAAFASRGRRDRRLRAVALSSAAALLTPAALHAAVCAGFLPIMGVSMPFVSYDPGAAMAGGAAIGFIVGVVRSPGSLAA